MPIYFELPVATAMVLTTVVIHSLGLLLLGRGLEAMTRKGDARLRMTPLSWEGWLVTVGLVLGLFMLHGLEIWLYAVLYVHLDAVPDIREAIYFSTSSYGTIGYGDEAIDAQWKLLGAIEGINGSILLGWSVAFFVNVMARMLPAPRRRWGRS